MKAIITIMVTDRGKCISTQPLSIDIDTNKSQSINAINRVADIFMTKLPKSITEVLGRKPFEVVLRTCVEQEHNLHHQVMIIDRYDVHYRIIFMNK